MSKLDRVIDAAEKLIESPDHIVDLGSDVEPQFCCVYCCTFSTDGTRPGVVHKEMCRWQRLKLALDGVLAAEAGETLEDIQKKIEEAGNVIVLKAREPEAGGSVRG